MSATEGVCPRYVPGSGRGGFGGHTCGKPVKDEGLCAGHLAGKRRREANREARRQESDAEQRRRAGADKACRQLAEHGIEALPHYDATFGGGYTGRVVVDGAAVLALLPHP